MNEEEILYFNWIWFWIRMQKIWFLSSKSLKRAVSFEKQLSFSKKVTSHPLPNVNYWLEGKFRNIISKMLLCIKSCWNVQLERNPAHY